jgi:putative transposase
MFLWRIDERGGFCFMNLIMPNHFHLLLTPAAEIPLEKALQFIEGGFSYRAKREINFPLEIWQASFVNHRIRDTEDYKHHHTYIWEIRSEQA